MASGFERTASATSFGEREARADVRDPDRVGAEALLGQPLAVDRADDRADRVGVRVVDVRVRHERVQERLDRRARHRRVELAAREVGDHLLVGHRVALDERQDLVEPEAGEARRVDRREIAARALDPEHRRLAAGVVGLGAP